jgi:ABC-2 type transport system permease protein
MFLPLLMIILSCDLISGEFSRGTIKLLLTRPMARWKILLSKYLALVIMIVSVLVITALLSITLSGIFFGYDGWDAPIVTGFSITDGALDYSAIQNLPQWQYLIMVFGLALLVSLSIGTISFMVSVFTKTTAASMGIMMSSLVAGGFLSLFINDWPLVKYLFMVNLRLTDYLSGTFPISEGMNLRFSSAVLGAWAVLSLIASFYYFTKRDILV